MTKTKSLKALSLALAVAALTGTMTTAFAATNVGGTGNGVAFGEGARATTKDTEYSIAIGEKASAVYENAIAIGNGANSTQKGVAIGENAASTGGDSAIAIGTNSIARHANNIAISQNAKAMGGESIAIGHDSYTNGTESIALGGSSSAGTKQSIALGNESVVGESATAGVAVGHKANVSGKYGLAMGDEAISTGDYSTAIGTDAKAEGTRSLAFGRHANSVGKESVAIGTNAKAEGTNSLAFGYGANAVSNNSVALGNATSANVADTKAEESYLSKEAYTSEEAGVVSVGNADSDLYRRITNVAGGAADHDAVNVLQLKSLESDLNDKIENLDSSSATIGGNTTINESGITIKSPETGNTTVINGDSVTTTTVNADTVNAGTVNTDKIVVGGNTYITKDGIDANNQTIKNVAPGVNGTDAVNLDQLNQATSTLNSSISHLETNVKKVAAGSAALAALHPLDFDSDDKLTFAVGFGAYKGEQAAAIGAFYRPNDNLMFSIGTALGNSDNQYNAGLSFKFGDSSPYTNMSKADMVNKLETQEKNMATLQADNAELKARLAKLEALVAGN